MSLRVKLYLIGGVTLIVAAVMLFFISQTVFTQALTSVERAQMLRDMQRAQSALGQNLAGLGSELSSYSPWDPVASLQAKSADIEKRLTDSFFQRLQANLAVFMGNDGTIIGGKGYDLKNGRTVPLPLGLGNFLRPTSPLVRYTGSYSRLSGLLVLPGGPVLVESRSLSTSGGEVEGTLVVARSLDASFLAKLSTQTQLSVYLAPVTAESKGGVLTDVTDPALVDGDITATPLDSRTMAGYLTLRDAFGEPAATLTVKTPRLVSSQQAESLRYFMLAFIGVVGVFGAVTVGLMERSLFGRLSRLTAQVRQARLSKGPIEKIVIKGKDELTLLADTINAGLTQINKARSQEQKQARSLVNTLEELKSRHQDLERANRQLHQLQEASAALSGSLEIREALAQLEHVALDIFDADQVWILRLEGKERLEGLRAFSRQIRGDAQLHRLFGCEGSDGRLPQKANGLLRTVFQEGHAIFIESIRALGANELLRLFGSSEPELGGLQSLAVVPLYADRLPVGLAISASFKIRLFTSDRKSTILLFAGQVAQALKNARLYEEIKFLGEMDSLSGLYNRRRSLEQLETEVARARRYQGTFSVLIADVDNFKLFNDTYGHPVGDEIIKRIAGLLRHRIRASDFVARFGGDEFILILPETYRAQAAILADHLRAALASLPYIAPDGASIPLRMSFGAASFPSDGMDTASLIATADANLYESKRWGGDMVTVERELIDGQAVDSGGFSTLDALVSAVDNKDHYTRRHSAQVAEHTAAIASALGLSDKRKETLQIASLLHDVGKIALPDRILRKPGVLTAEEVEAMKQHSLIGSMMISQHLPGLDEAREAVVSHHERWDGTGYPARTRGQEIPLLGRILALADAYSAMTTDRPYRAALEKAEAVAELEKGTGTQFDPELVPVFLSCLSQGVSATPTNGHIPVS